MNKTGKEPKTSGKGHSLGRTIKKLFQYYPVLAPVTVICILFSAVVSACLLYTSRCV